MKFITVLMLVGFMISVLYVTVNIMIIDRNTNIITDKDYTLTEVESIDKNDTLHLSDGTTVKSESIKEYIKVKQGSGTWYDKNSKCMVVEVLWNELISLYGVLILYTIILTVLNKKKVGFFFRGEFRGVFIVVLCFVVVVLWLYGF